LGVAVAKYWNNKRCPGVVVEAMECLGGAGYIEASIMPRLYREAPLNGIWEGSGNVICLDVLRTLAREPELPDLLREELGARVDPWLRRASKASPHDARQLMGALARLWQAHLLEVRVSEQVAQTFEAARQSAVVYGEALPMEAVALTLGRFGGLHA
jgi:putative acyl-CoA dehydrogenase